MSRRYTERVRAGLQSLYALAEATADEMQAEADEGGREQREVDELRAALAWIKSKEPKQ